MEELRYFEAPLAQFESEDSNSDSDHKTSSSTTTTTTSSIQNNKSITGITTNTAATTTNTTSSTTSQQQFNHGSSVIGGIGGGGGSVKNNFNFKGLDTLKKCIDQDNNDVVVVEASNINFMETFSGSLEDLVNTFDEKITQCFCNYDETTEKLAPVQIRSQEELMNDCQMWWTITGNYGNILPIDWSKTYTRKLQMPTLNLNEQARQEEEDISYSDEDEAVANDLDMHSLILGRSHEHEPEPPTADEVIKEIDFMMQVSEDSTPASECCCSEELDSCNCMNRDKCVKGKRCSAPFYQEKLNDLSACELNEVLVELETQIKENSEVLIAELALRDELEYEKELKNSFISHLLAVQTKRRQHNLDRKKNKTGEKNSPTGSRAQSKYLTTVIPYQAAKGPQKNSTLQVLIKILKAIEQDSPAVPTLLTDYILKVLCPT